MVQRMMSSHLYNGFPYWNSSVFKPNHTNLHIIKTHQLHNSQGSGTLPSYSVKDSVELDGVMSSSFFAAAASTCLYALEISSTGTKGT